MTGEAWDFAAWSQNQPDNWCAETQVQEEFLTIAGGDLQGNGAWNDMPAYGCDNDPVISYVIEWSADCNNDGIVDYGQCQDGMLADYNSNNIPDCCEQGIPCSICSACDINPTGIIDGADLGALLAFWGPASPALPRADINRDGFVNGADLSLLLANWGPCGL